MADTEKKPDKAVPEVTFSPLETKFILAFLANTTMTSVNTNWDLVAEQLEYKSVKSCKEYFRLLKKKHGLGGESVAGKITKALKNMASPKPKAKKRKVAELMDDDEENQEI